MADPYATGVLDPEEHDRMVADLAKIARDANLRPEWIWAKIDLHCTAGEIAWVRRFPFHSQPKAGPGCAWSVGTRNPASRTAWRRSPAPWSATSSAPG